MLTKNMKYFQQKPMNIPKVIILVDHGYYLKDLTTELQKVYTAIIKKIHNRLLNRVEPNKRLKEKQDL